MNKLNNTLNKISNVCLILLGIIFIYQSIIGITPKTNQMVLGGALFLVGLDNIIIKK